MSIFQEYYSETPFVDRFITWGDKDAVDVIIPLIHTNELWKTNLQSFYREIPIKRLLIGDGGCIDDSISVAQQFPRVTVLNHRQFASQGYSIRKLIEFVNTDWFVYLHSDVYLPPNWFEDMKPYRDKYDWIECSPHLTILLDYPLDHRNVKRPFSGAQLGATGAIQDILNIIEDDYLLRNEDIVLVELLQEAGYNYSRIYDVYHYHQEMFKVSPWFRRPKPIKLQYEMSRNEEVQIHMMQVKGIIKYLSPRPDMPLSYYEYQQGLRRLEALNALDKTEFYSWMESVNPAWLPFHKKVMHQERIFELQRTWKSLANAFFSFLRSIYYFVFGLPEE